MAANRPSPPGQRPKYAVPAVPRVGLRERWGRLPLAFQLPLRYLAALAIACGICFGLLCRDPDANFIGAMVLWMATLPGMAVLVALRPAWDLPLAALVVLAVLITAALLSGLGWLITVWRNAPG